MRLLVTGASGLLGLNLSMFASRQGHTVTGLVHSRALRDVPFEVRRVDLLKTDSALEMMESVQPDAIIHCAAIASINAAETQPALTEQMNAEVPGRLAEAAVRWGLPFVHISTDAVFNGRQGGYVETDPTDPLSVYARTKLAGEEAVKAANPEAIIARTVFYGWSLSGQRSLAEFFVNSLAVGQPLKGFTDTLFCPLYVEDLVSLLMEMLAADLAGTYHVVAPDHLSKYDFGVRIAKRFGFDPGLITPIKAADIDRGAARSLNLTLNPDKLRAALGHDLPLVDEGLDRFYERWQNEYPLKLQAFKA
jgi:dTDP-4-dehydrorhamnose reductase